MTRTTATETFHSKSPSIGSIRWKVRMDDPRMLGCYVFDSAYQNLPSRWTVLWLGRDLADSKVYVNVTAGGSAPEFTLEPVEVLEFLTSQSPLLRVEVTAEEEAEILERFERTASNIMHDRLAPVIQNIPLFTQYATSVNGVSD